MEEDTKGKKEREKSAMQDRNGEKRGEERRADESDSGRNPFK